MLTTDTRALQDAVQLWRPAHAVPTVTRIALALAAVSLCALFAWGVVQQSRLNTDMHAFDQSAYLDYAVGFATTVDVGTELRRQVPRLATRDGC